MAGFELQKDIFEFDNFIRHLAMRIDKMYDFIGTIQLKTQSLAVFSKFHLSNHESRETFNFSCSMNLKI